MLGQLRRERDEVVSAFGQKVVRKGIVDPWTIESLCFGSNVFLKEDLMRAYSRRIGLNLY